MTRGDRILALVIVGLAIVAIPILALARSGSAETAVVTGPSGRTVLDLGVDQTVSIEGLQGAVIVRIAGGRVHVVDSTCPDRVCVNSGAVDDRGGVIACVPNGVSVVVGEGERGLDAIVR